MLFLDCPDGSWLTVRQPMHALVSGQMMRAWGAPGFAEPDPAEELATACAQHDVAWMGWEAAPTLDPRTGRPHNFRAVGARHHAPMWAEGVARALASWGPLVALLISRHGSRIYADYEDRHQDHPDDAPAARHYRATQGALQARLADELGLEAAELERMSALVAVTDALSLAVCAGVQTAGGVGVAPLAAGGMVALSLTAAGPSLALDPWPFAVPSVQLSWQAQAFPASTVWTEEIAMRADLMAAPFVAQRARLVPAEG
jgi:hypothetical protein